MKWYERLTKRRTTRQWVSLVTGSILVVTIGFGVCLLLFFLAHDALGFAEDRDDVHTARAVLAMFAFVGTLVAWLASSEGG